MGYSISQDQHLRIEKNRREGRLCGGPSNHQCPVAATYTIAKDTFYYEGGVEVRKVHTETGMCTRHARLFPVGYRGENFLVTAVWNTPSGRVLTIAWVFRLSNSVAGNPRYRISFEELDGPVITGSDIADASGIGNPGMRSGDQVRVVFTRGGKVQYIRPVA
jgi:hypothetical protein